MKRHDFGGPPKRVIRVSPPEETVEELRVRIGHLEQIERAQRMTISNLRDVVDLLNDEIEELVEENDELREGNGVLRNEVAQLEMEKTDLEMGLKKVDRRIQ